MLLGPLAIAVLTPAHGAWWLLKVPVGLFSFALIGGFIKNRAVLSDILGMAYGGFLILLITYFFAVVFRHSTAGVILYILSVLILFTLYPLVLRRQRARKDI
jgi:hypothetical protein